MEKKKGSREENLRNLKKKKKKQKNFLEPIPEILLKLNLQD